MPVIQTATNIRASDLLEIDGDLFKVLKTTHITPGKGNAVVQVKMRNIKTGIQREQRFRSVETVKFIELDLIKMEYLYEDGEMAHFMNNETYEQIALAKDRIENELQYLLPNSIVLMQFYEGEIVGIDLPKVVELKVTDTAPYMKGASVQNQLKPAAMETGLVVQVPGFIETGETIRVDTASGEYIERAK